MSLLAAIIPLFAIIALGYVAVGTSYVPAGHVGPVADVVARIALPALIFQGLTGAPLGETVNPAYLVGYAGGSLAAFGAGLAIFLRVYGLSLPQGALVAVGMACSNSGFMGYPIALGLLGPDATILLAQCLIVENLMIIPLALVLGAGSGEGGGLAALRTSLLGMLRSPIVLALLAALAFTSLGLRLPAPLQATLDMLARISAPIALLVVGGTLATLPRGGIWGRVAVVAGGKLLLHPSAVALGLWLTGTEERWADGGVLYAAMPMLTIYPILASRVGLAGLAAPALLLAVVLSFATITALVPLLGL